MPAGPVPAGDLIFRRIGELSVHRVMLRLAWIAKACTPGNERMSCIGGRRGPSHRRCIANCWLYLLFAALTEHAPPIITQSSIVNVMTFVDIRRSASNLVLYASFRAAAPAGSHAVCLTLRPQQFALTGEITWLT